MDDAGTQYEKATSTDGRVKVPIPSVLIPIKAEGLSLHKMGLYLLIQPLINATA